MKLIEIVSRDSAEAKARDMYGSMGHSKAQAVADDMMKQGGYDGVEDGYSTREWLTDWFGDHKEAVQTAAVLIKQGKTEDAVNVLRAADPGLERHFVETIFDEITDTL